jgi:hypothetical protein
MSSRSLSFLFVLFVLVLCSHCSSSDGVEIPPSLLGTWIEDSVKNGLPGEELEYEKSSGQNMIKLEQQGKKAVLFRSNFYDPFKKDTSWSEPYTIKESGKNSWSISYMKRKVSLQLNERNQLLLKGLDMRSYNPQLIKKDPEPVEAIFIKEK